MALQNIASHVWIQLSGYLFHIVKVDCWVWLVDEVNNFVG